MERENYFSYKLTYINWACAVSVVLLHVINNSPKYRAESSLLNVLLDGVSNMANLAVPMFFAISGFLFFLNYDDTFETLIGKYKKRIKSLVIPYLFWNAMIWIMLAIIYKIPDAGQDRVLFGIQDFLRVVINADYSPMWFVKTLIVYMIIAPFIVLTWRNKLIPWVWICGFCILTFLGVNTRFIPIRYLPMYLGGVLAARNYSAKLLIRNCNRSLQIGAILLWVLILVVTFGFGADIRDWQVYLIQLLGIPAIWFGFDGFGIKQRPKRFFTISFTIYCMHYIVVKCLKIVIYLSFPHKDTVLLVSVLCIFIVTVLFITVFDYAMRKQFPKMWGILVGGR